MSTTLGDSVQTQILKHESHKLHHEFPVAVGVTIVKGALVTLNTAGALVLADENSTIDTIIGNAVMDAAAETVCTVMMRPHLITYGVSAGALDAGAVALTGNTTNAAGLYEFDQAGSEPLTQGYALEPATGAGQVIRIAHRA